MIPSPSVRWEKARMRAHSPHPYPLPRTAGEGVELPVMKDKRALQHIREEFQRFQLDESLWPKRRSFIIPAEKSDLLAHALRFLCSSSQVDRAAVFLYDEEQ